MQFLTLEAQRLRKGARPLGVDVRYNSKDKKYFVEFTKQKRGLPGLWPSEVPNTPKTRFIRFPAAAFQIGLWQEGSNPGNHTLGSASIRGLSGSRFLELKYI